MSESAAKIEAARRAYVAAMGTPAELVMRRALEREIDTAKHLHRKESRRDERCETCGRPAQVAKRTDGAGVRALLWCFECAAPACGGDSFITVKDLGALPDAIEPTAKQGSLF